MALPAIMCVMSTFGERVKELRFCAHPRLSQEALAQQIGVSRDAVAGWEGRGSIPSDPDIVRRLAEFFRVSIDFLYGMTDIRESQSLANQHDEAQQMSFGPLVPVPVLGSVRGGPGMVVNEELEGYEMMPAEDVRGGSFFILRVTGDSMSADHILDGSRVLVKRQESTDPNDIAVVIVNGDEATIKRVNYHDGKAVLIPSNHAHRPVVEDAANVRIIGRVTQVMIKL